MNDWLSSYLNILHWLITFLILQQISKWMMVHCAKCILFILVPLANYYLLFWFCSDNLKSLEICIWNYFNFYFKINLILTWHKRLVYFLLILKIYLNNCHILCRLVFDLIFCWDLIHRQAMYHCVYSYIGQVKNR